VRAADPAFLFTDCGVSVGRIAGRDRASGGRCYAAFPYRCRPGGSLAFWGVGADWVRVEVRLRPVELDRWRAQAVAAGVSVSELVRGRVQGALAGRAPRRIDALDAALAQASGWREAFLAGLGCGRSVAAACRVAGVSRGLVYRERAASREFAVAWELALQGAEQGLVSVLHEEQGVLSRSLRRAPLPLPAELGAAGRVRRSARLQLRLRRSELRAWQAVAARLGVGVSELVRRLVEGPGSAGAAALRGACSWRGVFVEALRRSGSVATACRVAGVSVPRMRSRPICWVVARVGVAGGGWYALVPKDRRLRRSSDDELRGIL
jgi:hypothetical protein